MLFIYNLLFFVGFLCFLPSLIIKYKKRPGHKKTYAERFGIFSAERRKELKDFAPDIWLHSVSVGETILALSFIKVYRKHHPDVKIVISTTTTTGQELARSKCDELTKVIFCPVDSYGAVKRTLNLLNPKKLIILETELWPNMIYQSKKRGMQVILINSRLSDRSVKGYRKAKCFFRPLLMQFDLISTQSEMDAERLLSIAPEANVINNGNMKFDQQIPTSLPNAELEKFFGADAKSYRYLLGASTHPDEEALIAESYLKLKEKFPELRLMLIPRHAERGNDIAEILQNKNISFLRKSTLSADFSGGNSDIQCLLADTTGEMLKFMNVADVVVMGKSLAGQDEGHNLIEPALLKRTTVCGPELKNFRFLFDLLKDADGIGICNDKTLTETLDKILSDKDYADSLRINAYNAVIANAGAAERTVECMDKI